MGELYIYDIVGGHLPDRLNRTMNTAKILTSQTNYEIMVAALEKYLEDLGTGEQAEENKTAESSLNNSFQFRETGGFKYLYQKVRLKSQV